MLKQCNLLTSQFNQLLISSVTVFFDITALFGSVGVFLIDSKENYETYQSYRYLTFLQQLVNF